MMKSGIYEQIINHEIEEELQNIDERLKDVRSIDDAETSKVLSGYVAEILEKKLNEISETEKGNSRKHQIDLINRIVSEVTDDDTYEVADEGNQLLALLDESDYRFINGKNAKDIARPETSIAYSSLFTGSHREPQMLSELKKEIESSSRIDMLVSFIKWSGLRQMIEELKTFTANGGKLRVICTSYMGATDVKAIEELNKLPNTEIKISYDTKRTRLHAKAYIFYRDTGFTTAYIGSSNMSNAALTSGLEWNVKATEKDMAATLQKINATFESYWHDSEFELYDSTKREKLVQSLNAEKYAESEKNRQFVFDLRPYTYQQEILDKLKAEREIHHRYKNLVVAATGCGKTMISAFDYKRYKEENPKSSARLLFVAHREEILQQSIDTFRGVLRDLNFAELYVGNYKPESLEYLFVSIQTMNSRKLYDELPEDFYDYIVVDEFHHAAAPTYQKMLNHFKPKILLGLTATPERMDGEDILQYFDGRIAAEIRLSEAIDRKLLAPFQYFGVTDNIDLSEVKWKRGSYDVRELESLYVSETGKAQERANYIVENTRKYTTSIYDMKALGFCVSVEHARFMAYQFNLNDIPAIELDGSSSDDLRKSAKKQLEEGTVKAIFTVDLYNEGVDIPSVNTVLFLRPTESLTIFLQQLGRGLRLDGKKECLTVLDFIGQANKKYNFEQKYLALLANTRHSLDYEIAHQFLSVPKGCYIQLEKKASEYILQNIRESIYNKREMLRRIHSFEADTGKDLTLDQFLHHYQILPQDLYKKDSFAGLCVQAGVLEDFDEPAKTAVTKALPKLALINSRRFILFIIGFLKKESIRFDCLTKNERRMLQMFYITIWNECIDFGNPDIAVKRLQDLSVSPIMCQEILELMNYNYESIDFIDERLSEDFEPPIDLHCQYTRDQLFAALDFMKPGTIREGVKWLPEHQIDVLLVTLNKSDKDYSPTTMYNDYAVNEKMFHWQSQSTTSENSVTGQRYIHHAEKGSRVLLCVRENKSDKWGNAGAYTILGLVDYISHTGSRPMNITWSLKKEIPARFLKETKKLLES